MRIRQGFIIDNEIIISMNYIKHTNFYDFYQSASLRTIKHYMYSLLTTLNILHKNNVLHRDIKPDNFLFNPSTNKGYLIDFGVATCKLEVEKEALFPKLAELLNYEKFSGKIRIGTKGFIAPELLFNPKMKEAHTNKVDIWSAGVILLSFFTKKQNPLFLNSFDIRHELMQQLIPLLMVFGDYKLTKIAKFFDIEIHIPDLMRENYLKLGLKEMIVRTDIGDDGVDLLEKLLSINFTRRISAEEALIHSFFDDIRDEVCSITVDISENENSILSCDANRNNSFNNSNIISNNVNNDNKEIIESKEKSKYNSNKDRNKDMKDYEAGIIKEDDYFSKYKHCEKCTCNIRDDENYVDGEKRELIVKYREEYRKEFLINHDTPCNNASNNFNSHSKIDFECYLKEIHKIQSSFKNNENDDGYFIVNYKNKAKSKKNSMHTDSINTHTTKGKIKKNDNDIDNYKDAVSNDNKSLLKRKRKGTR